jgi:hypothetical protein
VLFLVLFVVVTNVAFLLFALVLAVGLTPGAPTHGRKHDAGQWREVATGRSLRFGQGIDLRGSHMSALGH